MDNLIYNPLRTAAIKYTVFNCKIFTLGAARAGGAKVKYPKYIKTYDGYIGTFSYLDFGEFPVYRFPGGERIADNWEIENGSDNREDLI